MLYSLVFFQIAGYGKLPSVFFVIEKTGLEFSSSSKMGLLKKDGLSSLLGFMGVASTIDCSFSKVLFRDFAPLTPPAPKECV